MRAASSVTIAFGLVSIPVKVYVATESKEAVSFNLLHKGCGSRLKQQYVCASEGTVVERADMVKGYEFAKDQYVSFAPEELKEMQEKGTNTVEIVEFVPTTSVDPIFYDKAYFLGTDKAGAKPYALLAEAMRASGRAAIGRYAARGKEFIVQLRVVEDGIIMQQLLYAPEVRKFSDVPMEKAEVKPAELALAQQLIAGLATDGFVPSRYEDRVGARVKAAIQAKIEGKEVSVSVPDAPAQTNVVDLMAVLTASLGAAKPAVEPAKAAKAKKKEKVA